MTEMEELQNKLNNDMELSKSIICYIEEMSEVTKVLTKYLRNSSKYKKENLIEEMSHVYCLMNVIEYKFDIQKPDLENERLKLLKRYFQNKI